MKVVGYSVGVVVVNWEFGTHRIWSVLEHGEERAKEIAENHVRFLHEHSPEQEAKLITLYSDAP